MRPPLLYHLYVGATAVLVPFFAWIETRKLRAAGVPIVRAHEKLGHATAMREGSGPLIWFHAASVGESMSVLSLIAEMGRQMPRANFLITSGTATSAKMVANHLPPRTVHQFAPLDAPGPLRRFIRHWRPDCVVFVESELWPQMLRLTRDSGAKMILVNARLSETSQKAWKRRPKTAAFVLGTFDLILTQNDEMAQAMVDMHAPADRVARGINLKSLAAPLQQNPETLAKIRTSLKGRRVWVAASTHKGEEEIVLRAHARLLLDNPDLLLLLAPRHTERSKDVAQLIEDQGLSARIRSKGELPGNRDVYLADTLGELGNWYALSNAIFLGGSLKPIGGHNPFEVTLSGSGVISGPEVFNFSETYAEMTQAGVVRFVNDDAELAEAVDKMLNDTALMEATGRAARDYVRGKSSQTSTIATRLIRALHLQDEVR
ncbi:3-deoxy-D-manno-octulosonic acid transferase [Roseobacter litoralis]|uniref:3-deoxy-D-manno-octulosonic acid transferase n=1 Tax=Roseobacter litoralis (strain ATCC 49566 / DSM 6996 / JCM 21268 / NBRC 15278 / OCh 149) TaxID=391595 RepID=F7ZCR9_ROSLO|nr:3-deoxy-D-manno-octulosonic acid transferase [Roseobacter litoralis]AEI94493.1 putative 3-deoxy-D-manno-octulosonic-acid transferase [Roseobacter litoralis Och 149]